MEDLQTYLFDSIIQKYDRKSEAIKTMSDLLKISVDGIYRRMRGDSILTPQELFTLSRFFGVSLDQFIQKKANSVIFDFHNFASHPSSADAFLQNMLQFLRGIRQLNDVHIHLVSSDVPIFYYTFTPKLFKFKLYVWGSTIWNIPVFRHNPFSFRLFSPEIDRLIDAIQAEFIQLDSTELWSASLNEDTLNQITYFAYFGKFTDSHLVWELLEEVQTQLGLLFDFAQYGTKYRHPHYIPQGNLNIFHNELIHSVSNILLTSREQKLVFTPFATPSYLVTQDQQTAALMVEWFENIMDRSDRISGKSEKSRMWFFNQLKNKLEFSKKKLTNMLAIEK